MSVIDIEIDYRLGEKSDEEICAEHGIDGEALLAAAAVGGWSSGAPEYVAPQHIAVVEAYLKHWNRARALREAGCESDPGGRTYDVFRRPEVRRLIERRCRELQTRQHVTAEALMAKQMHLVNFDVRKLYDGNGELLPTHRLDDATAFALQAVEHKQERGLDGGVVDTHKYKAHDKNVALRNLQQVLGVTEKIELTGANGGPIEARTKVDLVGAARRIAFILARARSLQHDEPTVS